MLHFEKLLDSILREDVQECCLAVGEPPSVCLNGPVVRLDTKKLNEEDLCQFLSWAFPEAGAVQLPLDTSRMFIYSGREIDVLTTATSVAIVPRR